MGEVSIRTARPGDLPALRDVYRRASLSNPTGRDDLLAHPELLELGDEHVVAGRTRVASIDGRIVGFATLVADADPDRPVAELEDLFVDPDVRRMGVARRLVVDLVVQARGDGIRQVEVTGHPDAIPFYRALGFVVDGEAPTDLGPAPHLHLALP